MRREPVRSRRRQWRTSGVFSLLLVAVVGVAPVAAQEEDPGPLFDSRDAWIASAYFATAAAAFPFDEAAAAAVRDDQLQDIPLLRQGAAAFNFLGFPGSAFVSGGLWGVGRLIGNDNMADVGLHTGEALVLSQVVTYAIKLTAGRARPHNNVEHSWDFEWFRGLTEGEEFQSFPSGHSSAAFATAAALAHEMERIWGGSDVVYGLVTYTPASMVALARMFDNRHWASDVVFGAAIGAFSGWKVVQYNHDHPDNRVNRWFLAGSVAPGDLSTLRLGVFPIQVRR